MSNENPNIDNSTPTTPSPPQVETNSYNIETNSINSNSYFYQSSLNNSSSISMESLQEYIKYPMIYNAILREISRQAYDTNGFYSRTIDVRTSLPLLSYVLILRNKTTIKKDKKKKDNINLKLCLLGHEKTTRDILRKLDIDGTYIGILRDTKPNNKNITPQSGFIGSMDTTEGLSIDDNFMIQPLDLDYCKILGYQNNVAISAFNMQYFDQFKHDGLVNEIKNFPKDFIKAYMDYKKDASKQWYILDYRKTIALKSRSNIEEPYGRPYGLSAFVDIKAQEDYANSQFKLISELSSSIYYLVLPQGEKVGSCALNDVQQKNVIDAFKSAVKLNTSNDKAKISTLSLPPNTKIDRLAKDSSLIKDTLSDENLKKISTDLGFASSALNAASEGSSGFAGLQVNLDMISAQIFQMLEEISREYTRVLNEHEGNKLSEYVDIKYLPISYINKNDMYDKMKDLFLTAGGSRTYMVAASGISPEDYYAICDEERSLDMDSKYMPHLTSFTATDSADTPNPSDNLGGRPKVDDKNLSPNGAKTRATGANQTIKPSTK